jgi:hypothetical protein
MYIGEVVDFPMIESFKLLISWHITTQLVVGKKCAYDQAKADWSQQVGQKLLIGQKFKLLANLE